MSADGPNTAWVEPVIGFLTEALPYTDDGTRVGWQDYASSAWQFGCMALIKLGQAVEAPWGAEREAAPQLPKTLPRWDDISRVVLTVLSQRLEIEYLTQVGERYAEPTNSRQFFARDILLTEQEPTAPTPNIGAISGTGTAYVQERYIQVLESLGLVKNARWTTEAELILWREQPWSWSMNIDDDPRFIQGTKRCLETMPQDIKEMLHDLTKITTQDVAEAVDNQVKANAALVEKYPAQARFDQTVSPEGKFRGLIFEAKCRMDDLFFAKWRLTDGRLSLAERARALHLFHDPLAMKMRAAIMDSMGLSFPKELLK